MKHLFMTTILASALAGGAAFAQTSDPADGMNQSQPALAPPDGYTQQNTPVTADMLIGATIYDANGDSIGDVGDLVLDLGVSGGTVPEGGDAAMTGSNGTTGTDTMTGTGMSPDSPSGGTGAMPSPGSVESANDGGTAAAEGATTTDTSPDSDSGAVTHAVLDIGGFLGMGVHRVAVPVSDLTVFSNGSTTRVYLPWSRAQLQALPAYEENNPSSLGRSTLPPAN